MAAAFGLSENEDLPITLHPIGLGAENATLPLTVPDGNAGSASLLSLPTDKAAKTVEVPVRILSEYGAEIGLSRIDFVKIDVEGFEAKVLEGARTLFEKAPPKAIILEEHKRATPDNLPASLSILKDLGYEIFALPKRLFRLAMIPLGSTEAAQAHDYLAIAPTGTETVRKRLRI